MTTLAFNNDLSRTAPSNQHNPMILSSSDDDDTVAGQTSSNDEDECNKLAKKYKLHKKTD
jgi:hypothetical protein